MTNNPMKRRVMDMKGQITENWLQIVNKYMKIWNKNKTLKVRYYFILLRQYNKVNNNYHW